MKEQIIIKPSSYKPPRKTLWHFFWYIVDLLREENSMIGYIREKGGCTNWTKRPSGKIIKRYNLRTDRDLLHWYLLEQYFEGNLIEKPKEDAQPKS